MTIVNFIRHDHGDNGDGQGYKRRFTSVQRNLLSREGRA